MASLLLVTGAPGVGKTTLSARIAASHPKGVHVAADAFFAMPAHPVDPTRPASHAQNATVLRAVMRAAGAFAESGYDVAVDGILGPWFLPLAARELRPLGIDVEYVVLRLGLAEALRRSRARPDGAPDQVVRQMHRALAALGAFEAHVLDTTGLSVEATLEALGRRRGAGLRLDLRALSG